MSSQEKSKYYLVTGTLQAWLDPSNCVDVQPVALVFLLQTNYSNLQLSLELEPSNQIISLAKRIDGRSFALLLH